MKMGDEQRGSLTLESAIVIPAFIMMFLFVYGIFGIVSAQNQITHSLIQASKSLSLDPYVLESTELAGETETKFWSNFGDMIFDIGRLNNDVHFTAQTDWYKEVNNKGEVDLQLVRDRFVGYLAGGDEELADTILTELGVVDGLDGIDLRVSVSGKVMTLNLKYSLKYVFDFYNSGEIPIEQKIQTNLWKVK